MPLATMLIPLFPLFTLFTCLLSILMPPATMLTPCLEVQEKNMKQKRADSGSFVPYVDMGGIKPLSMPSMLHFFTHMARSCHVLRPLQRFDVMWASEF